MKKLFIFPLITLATFSLTGCDLINDMFADSGTDIHNSSFEPITGKFYLYKASDSRFNYVDTYFDINGSQGNFSLKYYENGVLKNEGKFQKIVTYEKYIGKIRDNLHFNVKCGSSFEHISTYTPSLNPIDQFRIIEEYTNSDKKYYLSELPFVMGIYLREGKTYQEEVLDSNETNYLTPTEKHFTSALDGFYKLDDDHYFYFLYPKINSYYTFAYFQYYSSSLNKPLEGFIQGRTVSQPYERKELIMTYSREVLFDKAYQDLGNSIIFGYYTFDQKDNMIDHFGTVEFSNNEMASFTFEHLSREWTDKEWDLFTKDESYHMPDPVFYDYIGGTYSKIK